MKSQTPKQGLLRVLRGDVVKFSALQSAFWFSIAIGSYQTVFMKSLGYSASMIGIVNALASVAGIIATPFWGMMSDKVRSLKKIVIFLYIIGAGAYLLVPTSAHIIILGLPALMILIPTMALFRYPFFTLSDTWLVHSSHNKGLNFGRIRSFGSFSFAVGGILVSSLIPIIGIPNVFYISAGIFLVVIWIGLHIDDVHMNEENKKHLTLKELDVGSLFKNYYYLIFLVFTFFLTLMTACDNNFLPFILEAAGDKAANLGIITGFRALMEMPMLLLFSRFRKKYPLHYLAIGAGVLYAAGAIMTGIFAKNIWHLLLFSVFSGLGSGIWIACGANYIFAIASKHLKATAQTIFGATSSVAGIAGNLVGGILVDSIGAKHFYVLIGLILLAAIIVYAGLRCAVRRHDQIEFPNTETA